MSRVFVVQNQHGLYWGKAGLWVGGEERQKVYRSQHRDEVVNTSFELSSKDIELRAQVLAVEIDAREQPAVKPAPPEIVARFCPEPEPERQADAEAEKESESEAQPQHHTAARNEKNDSVERENRGTGA